MKNKVRLYIKTIIQLFVLTPPKPKTYPTNQICSPMNRPTYVKRSTFLFFENFNSILSLQTFF